MPTSVVSICNMALSLIGDRATLTSIDPPEGSAQADHCARFWPIARDEALASYDWGFARRTAEIAAFATEDHPVWAYAFARPADFLVARRLGYTEDGQTVLYPGDPYFEEGTTSTGQPVFYTDVEVGVLRYTRSVNDPTRYPPKFVTAVSYVLAGYLAGAIVKGRSGAQLAQAMRQQGMFLLSDAAVVDANQSHENTRFRPSSLAARGAVGDTRTLQDGQYRRELPFWSA